MIHLSGEIKERHLRSLAGGQLRSKSLSVCATRHGGRGWGKDSRDNLPRGLVDKGSSSGAHRLLLWCLGAMGSPPGLWLLPLPLIHSGRIERDTQGGCKTPSTGTWALLCGLTSISGKRGTVGIPELVEFSRCDPNEDMLWWPSGPRGVGTKRVAPS